MNKSDIVAEIRSEARKQLSRAEANQREAQAGATHEETRAENDKDTRAIEAQYLSRGLAERVLEWQEAVASLENMTTNSVAEGTAISLCTLIEVEDEGGKARRYFLAPAGAGLKIGTSEGTVMVITPKSPLGRVLLGARLDDEVVLKSPKGQQTLIVTAIA